MVQGLIMSTKVRILIADDHAGFRKAIRLFLKKHDKVEVVGEAGDGREALRQAHSLHPDVVLMDINMPGYNGFEAARDIKRALPGTKIIFLTMYADDRYRLLAQKASADGFINKADLNMNIFQSLSMHATPRYIM
jgi:two-component system, NarL family, response regulator LiaR